jgi:hypothetical protein
LAVAPPKAVDVEDDDKVRPRGEELRAHPEVQQQHDDLENYHPPPDLRGIYRNQGTAELKSFIARHYELLTKNYGVRDFRMRVPTHHEIGNVLGQRLYEELMEAKVELFRRWKGGEEPAKLPEFGQSGSN